MPTFTNQRIQEQMLTDPRYALAQALQNSSSSTAPAQGGLGEALARAVGGGIAGYQRGRVMKEYQAKDNEARDQLAKALDPNLSRADKLAALRGVQGYEELAVKSSIEKPDFDLKGTAEQALFKQAAGQSLTPEENASLQAFDRLRSSEVMYDPRGNVVPKFGSLMQGQQQPAPMAQRADSSPALPPPAMGDGKMLLPAPATAAEMGGKVVQPDISLFAGMPQLAPTPSMLDNKSRGEMGDKVGKNLADVAAPTDINPVAQSTNALTMLADLDALNSQAFDGIRGPATQMVANIFGDSALSQGQQQSLNSFAEFDQKSKAIAAELLKPTVGGSQISNADIQFVSQALSVLPTASRGQRGQLIRGLQEVAQRRRDIDALEQQAAAQGRPLTPQDIAAYYQSKGVDYSTGKRMGGDVSAPPEIIQQAGEGGVVRGPDGRNYIVQQGKLVPQ